MSSKGTLLVSGANGEDDTADWEDIERRWRTAAPEERIGGVRFSLWKTDTPLRAKAYRFTRSFFGIAILVSFGFIASGAWVAGRIRQGDFLSGQIFAVGVFVAMHGGAFVAVVASRRSKHPVGEAVPPPQGIPSQAVACQASVSRRGRCVGWLWFEGDLMLFRGAGFDLRLRREDFRNRGSLLKAFKGGFGILLRGPKGVSEYRLSLAPGTISSEAFALDRSLWKALEADLAAWESGSFSREPSLFPPIRPVPTIPARLRWGTFVLPPLFIGTLLGFAGLVLPIEPQDGDSPPSSWGLALAGALFGSMGSLLLWTSDRAGKAYAREADRASEP